MTRDELRKVTATHIFRTAQHAPMAMTADGGEMVTVLAELILREVDVYVAAQHERTLAAVRAYAADVAEGPYPPAAVAVKVLELLDGEGTK